MKVLLDTCLSVQARDALKAAGHDVVWGGDWKQDPGDEVILARAYSVVARICFSMVRGFSHRRKSRTAGPASPYES